MLFCCGAFLSITVFQRLTILHCIIYSGVNQVDYFKVDNCLSSVFKSISAAKRCVYELFDQYVNS